MAITTFTAAQILTAAQMNAVQSNDYNQTVSTKTASYTLVAADVGTRVVMNSASATTITVNTSLFAAGDTLFIGPNLGVGVCTITAGTATVSSTSSLALAQYGGGTLYFTSAGVAIFFLAGSAPVYGTATGGIGAPTAVTINSVNYNYLEFQSTGTLTVTSSGFFDYCAVGGGGGAMSIFASYAGGGGGAGQVLIGSVYLSANQTITIGAGGAFFAYASDGTQGGDTSVAATSPFTATATGNKSITRDPGTSNSSIYIGGGVGSAGSNSSISVTETTAIGYMGGNSTATTNAGGGGGQSGRGGNGSVTTGGTGGAGFDVSAFIGGSALRKAMGGGGGGSVTGGTAATNGVAGSTSAAFVNGSANSGGGAGGGYNVRTSGGQGGSGICYIRFKV